MIRPSRALRTSVAPRASFPSRISRVMLPAAAAATALLALFASPSLHAQSAAPAEGGVYLTLFRSPSTGIELRRARLAVNAGFYPTILEADGQDEGENTNFIRVGATAYLRPSGWSPFITPSLVFSLDDDWSNGVLTEAGVRVPLARRAAFRLGVGVLTAFDGEVRVNPTVGLDIRLGGRRQ